MDTSVEVDDRDILVVAFSVGDYLAVEARRVFDPESNGNSDVGAPNIIARVNDVSDAVVGDDDPSANAVPIFFLIENVAMMEVRPHSD